MLQQQSIAIYVTKCIAAIYKLDTGSSIELSSRCLIEGKQKIMKYITDEGKQKKSVRAVR